MKKLSKRDQLRILIVKVSGINIFSGKQNAVIGIKSNEKYHNLQAQNSSKLLFHTFKIGLVIK